MDWNYPEMYAFGDRPDLKKLDYLFLTIGNGYEWIDGDLVDKHDQKDCSLSEFLSNIFWHYDLGKELHEKAVKAGIGREWDEEKETQELVNWLNKPFSRFYPVSEKYSRCFNVPDNVKQDWLEAIIKFLEEAVEMDDSYFIDEDYANINDYTKDLAHNSKSRCKKQLAHLKKKFRDRL